MLEGSPTQGELNLLLDVALEGAKSAGDLLLEWFAKPPEGVGTKSTPTDLVSNADRESEALLKRLLNEWRPDDGLVGEEGERVESTSGYRWIVDPLDGTVNFLFKIPIWCVSVAVEDAEGIAVGVVHDPNRDESFAAMRGNGATLNGAAIHVSDTHELAQALIATGFAYYADIRAKQAQTVARVLPRVRDIRRAGSAALDFCSVACGRVDGFYEAQMEVWDRAAGMLVVQEAGGVVTELSVSPQASHGVVAAGPALHDALRALVT